MTLFSETTGFSVQSQFFPATNRGGSAKPCGGNANDLSRSKLTFTTKPVVSSEPFLYLCSIVKLLRSNSG